MTTYPMTAKLLLELRPGFVLTGETQQPHLAAQRGDIVSHVAGATGTPLFLPDMHDGNRRFRRNPAGGAVPVTIEHQVTGHQHPCSGKVGQ